MSILRLLCLTLSLAWLMACGDEVLVDRPADPPQTDSFEQIKASSIDILFVVDNSRSMTDHQDALAANFSNFLSLMDEDLHTGAEGVDYRLAVATTDVRNEAGALRGEPAIIQRGAGYDPVKAFQRAVKVGKDGSALSQGLLAAELALETAGNLKDAKGQPAFLRPDAFLYLIFVSDDRDMSFGEVRYFQRRFESIKGRGNENTVLASTIAGPLPNGCNSGEVWAMAGDGYVQLAELTGGVVGNICTEDWASTLRDLAFSGLGLRKRFQLSKPVQSWLGEDEVETYAFDYIGVHYPCSIPDDDPLLGADRCGAVSRSSCGDPGAEKPGVACIPYWGEKDGVIFDPRENTLVFSGTAIPPPGSTIWATYTPRKQ